MPGRTGSSFLVSSLSKHPHVVVEGERLVQIETADSQAEWIESFYSRRRFRVRACGFKTKLKDVRDQDGLCNVLQQNDVKVIQMLRQDPLRRAISTINARRLKKVHGVWNRLKGMPDLEPLLIDLDELDAVLEFVESSAAELSAFVNSLDLAKMTMQYEDLLANPARELGRVQNFIGVEERSLESDTAKGTPDRLELAISNYEELVCRYRGSKYEQYLD